MIKSIFKFILTFTGISLVFGLPIGIYEKYILKSPIDNIIYGYTVWGALFVTIIFFFVTRKKTP